MVKTLPSNARSAGSIPGQETKTPHALWPKKKPNSNATNSMKTSKNAFKKIVLVVIMGCYALVFDHTANPQ